MKNDIQHIDQVCTVLLEIKGLIQGIGFRPFIYRLAKKHGLNGWVKNSNSGVEILIHGSYQSKENFISEIESKAPKAALINHIHQKSVHVQVPEKFIIQESTNRNDRITIVSPDIAVCDDCLKDMKQQKHRLAYPFTNCTNCGPRFSIIERIPYDRPNTSMSAFEMCSECKKEYLNIEDRRFHAQPVACNHCGPTYFLQCSNKTITDLPKIFSIIKKVLDSGDVIAMKGLGGYHLTCDPNNENALKKLRQIKARDGKPFAVMVKNTEVARQFANLNKEDIEILESWQRPVLLVESKNKNIFPKNLASGLNTLGLFLPYLPLHHQLFEKIKQNCLVMTSANLSDCPIIINEETANKSFDKYNIPILNHNRKIINRVDDSVACNGILGIQIIRRSRGYAPLPVEANQKTEGILATGAELSGAFCIGKENQAILSQYIGDLKNYETMHFYEESYNRYKNLFRFEPALVACDMHPDYLSTKFAHSLNLQVIPVQHHHAHIAACMAEHHIDEKVIGISYDGTGWGTDNKIWGSEIMVADMIEFERMYHFEYVPVPGGDLVSKEPWRSGLAYLQLSFPEGYPDKLNFGKEVDKKRINMAKTALSKNINAPDSCSAGRLFDAVASITGVCYATTYHAEAPIRLENIIKEHNDEYYPIELSKVISWKSVIQAIAEDMLNNIDKGVISARFHNTVARIAYQAVIKIHNDTGINKVMLTGGTFQNQYLTKKLVDLIHKSGLKAYINNRIPCNDGGIALGQMSIAAKRNLLCV